VPGIAGGAGGAIPPGAETAGGVGTAPPESPGEPPELDGDPPDELGEPPDELGEPPLEPGLEDPEEDEPGEPLGDKPPAFFLGRTGPPLPDPPLELSLEPGEPPGLPPPPPPLVPGAGPLAYLTPPLDFLGRAGPPRPPPLPPLELGLPPLELGLPPLELGLPPLFDPADVDAVDIVVVSWPALKAKNRITPNKVSKRIVILTFVRYNTVQSPTACTSVSS